MLQRSLRCDRVTTWLAWTATLAAVGCRDVKLGIPIDATEKTASATLIAEAGAKYSVWVHFNIDPPEEDAPRFCHELQLEVLKGDKVLAEPRCYGFPTKTCSNSHGRTAGDCESDCEIQVGEAGPVTIKAKLTNTGKRCEPGPAIGKREVACGREYDNCFHALTDPKTQINDYDLKLVKRD
jgi:hypothetical protein